MGLTAKILGELSRWIFAVGRERRRKRRFWIFGACFPRCARWSFSRRPSTLLVCFGEGAVPQVLESVQSEGLWLRALGPHRSLLLTGPETLEFPLHQDMHERGLQPNLVA